MATNPSLSLGEMRSHLIGNGSQDATLALGEFGKRPPQIYNERTNPRAIPS
jgi:hypothetical protein